MKLLILLLFTTCNILNAQLPFYDGFETGSFAAGGWVVSGSAGISTQNPAEGMYCTEGPDTWGIVKYINNISVPILTVEFRAKASQLNTTCLIFRMKDNIGGTSAGIFFNDVGILNGVDGPGTAGVIPLFPYDIDTWYWFRFEMDMTLDQYDLYIDNVLRGDDFHFFSAGFTYPYLFTWSSVATSGSAWVDDVKIYSGTLATNELDKNISDLFYFSNSQNKLFLKKDLKDDVPVQIYNLGGQLVQSTFITSNESVDLSQLTNGFYMIHTTINNQNYKYKLYR